MRKLLAMFLVLGMATMANAAIQLSVDGSTELADEIVQMAESEVIILDAHLGVDDLLSGGDMIVRVTPQVGAGGSLNTQNMVFMLGYGPDYPGYVDFVTLDTETGDYEVGFGTWEAPWGIISATPDEVKISGGNLGNGAEGLTGNSVGEYIIFDGLEFHCEGLGEVLIELIAASDIIYYTWDIDQESTPMGTTYSLINQNNVPVYAQGTVLDSIMIHQIPEPMTLSLLAMGGLALLRRRR